MKQIIRWMNLCKSFQESNLSYKKNAMLKKMLYNFCKNIDQVLRKTLEAWLCKDMTLILVAIMKQAWCLNFRIMMNFVLNIQVENINFNEFYYFPSLKNRYEGKHFTPEYFTEFATFGKTNYFKCVFVCLALHHWF